MDVAIHRANVIRLEALQDPGPAAGRREHLELTVRRNWSKVIERLNRSKRGELRIRMGSPGRAQVTRCRLLEQWSNIQVRTERSILHLQLVRPRKRRSR